MKWLKLDCDFRNDPRILSMIHQFGGKEACSFWTLLLSYVGANGVPGCEVQIQPEGPHSLNLLSAFLCTKPKHAATMLEACAQLALILPERWRNDSVISIPKMLTRLDDTSRKVRTKSGLSPDRVHKKKKKKIVKAKRAAPLVVLGEFGRVQVTPQQYENLKTLLNGKLEDYISRFDLWVNDSPEAQHAGIRRRDRHAYESIRMWYDRDMKEGKNGQQRESEAQAKQRRTREGSASFVRRMDEQTGSGIPAGDQRSDAGDVFPRVIRSGGGSA